MTRNKRGRRGLRSMVAKMISKSEEPKRYSFSYANSGIGTSAGAIVNDVLDSVVAGTNSNQRVGHEIKTTGFYAQFMLKYNAAASPTPQVVRVILVQRRDRLSSLDLDGVGVASVIDPDRYIILYDRMISLVQNGDTHFKRFTIKRKFNRKIRYDATTGSPVTNGLQLYLVSDNNTNKPTLDGHLIIHYKDR